MLGSRLDLIGRVYGLPLSKELLDFEYESAPFSVKVEGFISNPNYSFKRKEFILFINHRLVQCTAMKRSIEGVYQKYLPKGSSFFSFLSVSIKAENVDVNAHPTKTVVHFLHEDKIIEAMCMSLDERLKSANQSRVFYIQTTLPVVATNPSPKTPTVNSARISTKIQKTPAHKLVRTDSRDRTLDSYIQLTQSGPSLGNRHSSPAPPRALQSDVDSTVEEVELTSILNLRAKVRSNEHIELGEMLKNHTWVGCFDDNVGLIQHNTKLLMINYRELSSEIAYQIVLFGFSKFGLISINESGLRGLLDVALGRVESWDEAENQPKDVIATKIVDTLIKHRDMLQAYFSIQITPSGDLVGLPVIFPGTLPNFDLLPEFILMLGATVNWTDEEQCFEDLAQCLATLYTFQSGSDKKVFEKSVELDLMPILRLAVAQNTWLENQYVKQVASLGQLYKIFERC